MEEYRDNPDNKDRIAELRNKNNKKYSKNNWYVIRHKIQSQLSTLCGRNGKYNGAKYKDIDLNACVDHLIDDALSKGYRSIKEIKKTHHIDHIIPVSYYSVDEFTKAYSPLNLRWLPMAENCSRGNKLRKEDIKMIRKLPLKIYPNDFNINKLDKGDNDLEETIDRLTKQKEFLQEQLRKAGAEIKFLKAEVKYERELRIGGTKYHANT